MNEDVLTALFEAANDHEATVIENVAKKAGLIWICPVEPWTNRAGETCGRCGRTQIEANLEADDEDRMTAKDARR
jgi:hypothetical protein